MTTMGLKNQLRIIFKVEFFHEYFMEKLKQFSVTVSIKRRLFPEQKFRFFICKLKHYLPLRDQENFNKSLSDENDTCKLSFGYYFAP